MPSVAALVPSTYDPTRKDPAWKRFAERDGVPWRFESIEQAHVDRYPPVAARRLRTSKGGRRVTAPQSASINTPQRMNRGDHP